MTYRKDNRVALENDAPRVDIVEKVTGTARYTTDYYLPKMMWAAYIISDFGDASAAKIERRSSPRREGCARSANRQGSKASTTAIGWDISAPNRARRSSRRSPRST